VKGNEFLRTPKKKIPRKKSSEQSAIKDCVYEMAKESKYFIVVCVF
jgi:hypothetical protein